MTGYHLFSSNLPQHTCLEVSSNPEDLNVTSAGADHPSNINGPQPQFMYPGANSGYRVSPGSSFNLMPHPTFMSGVSGQKEVEEQTRCESVADCRCWDYGRLEQ